MSGPDSLKMCHDHVVVFLFWWRVKVVLLFIFDISYILYLSINFVIKLVFNMILCELSSLCSTIVTTFFHDTCHENVLCIHVLVQSNFISFFKKIGQANTGSRNN